MPIPNKDRYVDIYYDGGILGFSFFDKDQSLIFETGNTSYKSVQVETMGLADNELIVWVLAKLYDGRQSLYTNFAFQIAAKYYWANK